MRFVIFVASAVLAGLFGSLTHAAPTQEEMAKLPLKTVERQAKSGDTASQVELARRYGTGEGGAKKDQTKAAHLLWPAVEKGDPTAQYYLGLAYTLGAGVQQDDSQAVLLFDAAAKQGEKNAQYLLAMAIVNGNGGILPSWTAAVPWFEKAAEQDVVNAQYQLGNAYAAGAGVKKDYERAAYWYRRGLTISKNDPILVDRMRILLRNGHIKRQPGDPEEVTAQPGDAK
jgi:TPR repeat protein